MDNLKYAHLLSLAVSTPWAILPEKLAIIMDLLAYRAEGGHLTDDEIQARIGAAARPQTRQSNSIAVLPLHGTIIPRGNMMAESSGATSVETFAKQFRAAMADPSIGAVVLDVDSPGGAVTGVDELAAEIHAARGQKPIMAIASPMAASAAYWLATAADELSVTPTGEVGSIGVFATHQDISGMLAKKGVAMSLISAGKYKTEGSPYEPLSDEARAAIQERVNDYYGMFTEAVARHRGIKASAVRSGFGEGRVVGARKALAEGMVDHIETMDQLLARMAGRMRPANGMRAGADWTPDVGAAAKQLWTGAVAEAFGVPEESIPQYDHVALMRERTAAALSDLDLRRRRLRLAAKRSNA